MFGFGRKWSFFFFFFLIPCTIFSLVRSLDAHRGIDQRVEFMRW